MTDEEIIESLTAVQGIGRWTAEMFLMFILNRPDVLPVDDLGLRSAAKRFFRLKQSPTAAQLKELGESWRPYRTIASWYLWRAADRNFAKAERKTRAKPRGKLKTNKHSA